jgi:hypothetical protein
LKELYAYYVAANNGGFTPAATCGVGVKNT